VSFVFAAETVRFVTRDAGVSLTLLSAFVQTGHIKLEAEVPKALVRAFGATGAGGAPAAAPSTVADPTSLASVVAATSKAAIVAQHNYASAAAMQMTRTSDRGKVPLTILPCPYRTLTTAPLLFAVSLFARVRRPVPYSLYADRSSKLFPLRHVPNEKNLEPCTLVITSGEACIVRVDDPFDPAPQLEGQTVVDRCTLASVVSVGLASQGVFPLLFCLQVDRGSRIFERWVFLAAHPNTIANLVIELRNTLPAIRVEEVTAEQLASAAGVGRA
jgi:hypothetical protein